MIHTYGAQTNCNVWVGRGHDTFRDITAIVWGCVQLGWHTSNGPESRLSNPRSKQFISRFINIAFNYFEREALLLYIVQMYDFFSVHLTQCDAYRTVHISNTE